MNGFENKLILRDEPYQNGLFPKIPNYTKRGSAFVFTGGCNGDIVVDNFTTVKQIRKGKYTRLIEISTQPYTREIKMCSSSRETHYSFDVSVNAVIQVNDPVVFYENRNIDVDAYFYNLLSMDIRKITRKYSILDYEGMDEELSQRLLTCSVNEATGFSYQISAVDAVPGEKAQEYVQKAGKQQLNAMLKRRAGMLRSDYASDYESAIMNEVVEGTISEKDAILMINEYQNKLNREKINELNAMREMGFVTDSDARDSVAPMLEKIKETDKTGRESKNIQDQDISLSHLNKFYDEGEE